MVLSWPKLPSLFNFEDDEGLLRYTQKYEEEFIIYSISIDPQKWINMMDYEGVSHF